MIEIKVNTIETNGSKQKIGIETSAKHSGSYSEFVAEMSAVFEALDKTDHGVFMDALTNYLAEKAIDNLKKCDESEGDDDE